MKKLNVIAEEKITPDIGSVQNPDGRKRYEGATNKFNQIARDSGATTWGNIESIKYIIRDTSKYNFNNMED